MVPGKVLVVDDVESHRYIVSTWLRRAGFEVTEAATGAEALAKVRPDLDVVVLDVNLPDMSGTDVCAAIKGDRATASVAVLHMSATAVDVRSRARGLDEGADAYLIEPLDREELLATIRALTRSNEARRKADRLAERLTRLTAATLPVNAAGTLNRLLEAASSGAADVFGEPALATALTGDGGVARALCPRPGASVLTDVGGAAFGPGWPSEPATVPGEEVPHGWRRLLSRIDVAGRHWYLIPIRDRRGLAAGGLAITLPVGAEQLPVADAGLLRQLAEAMRVALENLRAFTEEHRIAITLQRALLPGELPRLGRLTFEGRYLASTGGVSVGGDFYDVFELASGQVAVVIGDVQGHCLHAATVMAELRYSLRAYLAELHDAPTTLALLDAMFQRNHPEETATVVLLLFDASSSHVYLANAGHLPPLLVIPGDAVYLEGTGPLLGAGDASIAAGHLDVPVAHLDGPVAHLDVPPDCCFILVTDGLIERRNESLETSLTRMRQVVLDAATLDPERIADALLEQFATSSADDDIAVLIVRARP